MSTQSTLREYPEYPGSSTRPASVRPCLRGLRRLRFTRRTERIHIRPTVQRVKGQFALRFARVAMHSDDRTVRWDRHGGGAACAARVYDSPTTPLRSGFAPRALLALHPTNCALAVARRACRSAHSSAHAITPTQTSRGGRFRSCSKRSSLNALILRLSICSGYT